MRSPRWRPASWAGVFGNTEAATIPPLPSSGATWMPMPTNVPDSDWFIALASAAVMNEVWPVSPIAVVMPWIAA